MLQEPYEQQAGVQLLFNRLRELAFREQLEILLRATRQLSNRDKAEILGTTGLYFLKTRFVSIVLRFVLKHLLQGILWSGMYLVVVLICIFLLALLEQTDPKAVTPVVAASVAFFAGFLSYVVINMYRDVARFLKRTVSKEEREQLLNAVNNLKQQDRVAVLRAVSSELVRGTSGSTFLTSLLTGFALLAVAGLLIGLIMLFGSLLPAATGLLATLLLVVAAVLGFSSGLFVPRLVQNGLYSRHVKRSEQQIVPYR